MKIADGDDRDQRSLSARNFKLKDVSVNRPENHEPVSSTEQSCFDDRSGSHLVGFRFCSRHCSVVGGEFVFILGDHCRLGFAARPNADQQECQERLSKQRSQFHRPYQSKQREQRRPLPTGLNHERPPCLHYRCPRRLSTTSRLMVEDRRGEVKLELGGCRASSKSGAVFAWDEENAQIAQ